MPSVATWGIAERSWNQPSEKASPEGGVTVGSSPCNAIVVGVVVRAGVVVAVVVPVDATVVVDGVVVVVVVVGAVPSA